jgi:hypothetical protein
VNRWEHTSGRGLVGERRAARAGNGAPTKGPAPDRAPGARSAERTAARAVISGSARNPTPRVGKGADPMITGSRRAGPARPVSPDALVLGWRARSTGCLTFEGVRRPTRVAPAAPPCRGAPPAPRSEERSRSPAVVLVLPTSQTQLSGGSATRSAGWSPGRAGAAVCPRCGGGAPLAPRGPAGAPTRCTRGPGPCRTPRSRTGA